MNKGFALILLITAGICCIPVLIKSNYTSNPVKIFDTHFKLETYKDSVVITRQIKKFFNNRLVLVTLKSKNQAIGNLLALPGWNYPDTQWCQKTSLCEKALKRGYNLIFVEMQKSLYLREYYPETDKELARHPTRKWLMDSVWLPLIKNGTINGSLKSYVIGLSTGGRGAAILGLEYPNFFSGVAALSGDFNPNLEPNDRLMIKSLGPKRLFNKRWNGDNNLTLRTVEMKTPIYIGHGKKDRVVSYMQSLKYYQTLVKVQPKLTVKLNLDTLAGHDYKYWDSEVDSVLNFFDQIQINSKK